MKNRLRDGEAFDRLVEEHYDDVLAYCRRHAPSYDEAPDVAQEAFLRFVRSGRSPIEGKPLAYLLTIARNLCIDASRAKRPPAVPLDVDVPDRSPGADPAAACAGSEVGGLIGALDPELREVVELRFGLRDGRARTLEEVGREFNVTRERIRQIEAKALRKLRHPSRSRKLKDYLE